MACFFKGDCAKVLPSITSNSVDAIVTDPPYGLNFMGQDWDSVSPTSFIFAELLKVAKPGTHLCAFGSSKLFHRTVTAAESAGWEPRDTIAWVYGQGMPKTLGTLKPAMELICVMRKPLEGTLKANLESYGVGALNAAECLVDTRHPANFVHDGSDEVLEHFPMQKSGANPTRRGTNKFSNCYNTFVGQESCTVKRGEDRGSAARFFYCAKASKQEREGNAHPTVKPIELMRWLVRLVARPGQLVLDPFMGSGTTGVACKREGMQFIGIEQNESYMKIAKERIHLG